MLTLNDGRKELYQWDTGRTATVDIECDVVHFANLKYGESLAVEVKGGKVAIPNKLLMSGAPIYCWAFVADENGNYTKQEQTLNVNKRAKPSDYVYTETETLTWKYLDERITELEKGVTVSTMTGATAETDGAAGLVPAPKAGEQEKFLKGDGTWEEADKTLSKDGYAADAKAVGEKISELSVKISDGVSWNELKDKPFYLNKTLFIALTKDDFTVSDQGGNVKYLYRSTPKLDWFTSAESIAFEIEIIGTNGKRHTATQDSLNVSIKKDYTYDDYEFWYGHGYSGLFDIVSGVDLDFYDDEDYYYKDEWGVLVNYAGSELSEINIKIYRVDAKKIPKNCLDATIGKTAITIGSVLEDSESEISPSVVVPYVRIPISPSFFDEDIYYDRISNCLKISGNLFSYEGVLSYRIDQVLPTTAGSSISFDISSEGDALWDKIGSGSKWYNGSWLLFWLSSNYSGGGVVEFLSRGYTNRISFSAVASSNLGHLYTVVFEYTNSYKTLNVTIKCVV